MWPMLLATGAGLLAGKMKGDADRKNAQAMNNAAAEQTRYSWASGGPMGQLQGVPSAWGSMLQGGMTGAMIGSQLGGGAEAAAPEAASAGSAQMPLGNYAAKIQPNEALMAQSQANLAQKPSLYAGGFSDFKPKGYSLGNWDLLAKK